MQTFQDRNGNSLKSVDYRYHHRWDEIDLSRFVYEDIPFKVIEANNDKENRILFGTAEGERSGRHINFVLGYSLNEEGDLDFHSCMVEV